MVCNKASYPNEKGCRVDRVFADRKAHLNTVYLDTSFLSQMAKAEMRPRLIPNAEAWSRLFDALRNHISRGTAIWPASEFQMDESPLLKDQDIKMKISAIQHELSNGYCFKYWGNSGSPDKCSGFQIHGSIAQCAAQFERRGEENTHVSNHDTSAVKEKTLKFLDGPQKTMPLGRSYPE